MSIIGMKDAEQRDIFKIVAAVLHLGNIQFNENSNNYANIINKRGSFFNLKTLLYTSFK